jgi:A/G-specific adenine glycosylase
MTDFFPPAFASPDAAWSRHFQKKLLAWFAANRRPLPWREDYQPYHVWISEVMLQQTQMGRAVDYFRRWIARFPDVAAVAAAERDELLKYWEGLGYYSRIDNLHRAARAICERHGGALPERLEELQQLPGIGRYTAAAIASIAFGRDVALVDANVSRLFARLFDLDQPLYDGAGRRLIEGMAAGLLPAGQARDYNQALMELGALLCLPKRPRCQDCPLSELCLAKKRNTVANRPVPRPPAAKIDLPMAAVALVAGDRVLIRQRPAKGMWAGLWEFPGLVLPPGDEAVAALRRELPFLARLTTPWIKLARIEHHHTKYRVLLDGYLCRLAASPKDTPAGCRWVRMEELAAYAFSAGHRRLAGLLPPFSTA